jgi:anti-sigma factor RsiW
MNCEHVDAQLDPWLDGDLSAAAAAALAEHAAGCERCTRRVAGARELKTALRVAQVPAPRPEFFAQALARCKEPPARGRRAPHLIFAGLGGALAAGLLAIALLPLWVRGPGPSLEGTAMTVALAPHESRTINLVFAAGMALDDVSLIVELPQGVELAGRGGSREVAWSTQLRAGNNVLPLELVAMDGNGGTLKARLRHGDREKVFVVEISVG